MCPAEQPCRLRELQARYGPRNLGRKRRWKLLHPGLHDRHQRERRRDGPLQGGHAGTGVPHRRLPARLLRRQGRARGRDRAADRCPAPVPAVLPDQCGDRARRLRQLGRVRVVDGPLGHCLRRLRGQARAHRRNGGQQSHPLRGAQRQQSLRCPAPDGGHHVAGLQPVRGQQPLRRSTCRSGLQGELQPADHHSRHEPRGQRLQR